MKFVLDGVEYPAVKDAAYGGATGIEVDTIETHFGVFYDDLMSQLADDKIRPKAKPGCTPRRAYFAYAWLAIHRVNPEVTIGSLMAQRSFGELSDSIVNDDPPTPDADKKPTRGRPRPTETASATPEAT